MPKKKASKRRVARPAFAEPYYETPASGACEEFVEPCEELPADSRPHNGLEVEQGPDKQAPEQSHISSEGFVQQAWTS